jgi:putative toxin-antitoxin system antitoxin component (TIGR02293 family)
MNLNKIYQDDRQLIKASRDGITKEVFLAIVKTTGLPIVGFTGLTHITARTLERKKPGEKLAPEASERAILIGKLYFKGFQLFGEKSKFLRWMDHENIVLGGKKPKELLDTITGIAMVQDELMRIEYGVVA